MIANWVRSEPGAPAISINISNEIKLLDKESDPELRAAGRLHLAARLEGRHPELAAQIYAQLAEDPSGLGFSRQAQAQLESLEGRGNFGLRFEGLLRRNTEELFSSRLILPMMAGSVVFSLTRGLVAARLAAGGGVWARGFSGRALAATTAFGAEVPTFVILQNLGKEGTTPWAEELPHGALSLGLLRLSHAALASPLQSLPGRKALVPLTGVGGLLALNFLEQKIGWRPPSGALAAGAESLLTYLSLIAGMRAGRSLLGPGFTRWEAGLAWLGRGEGRGNPGLAQRAWALPNALAAVEWTPKNREAPLMMTGSRGEGPSSPRGRGPNWSIPPTLAKRLSVEEQGKFMNPRLDPPLRWDTLEKYRKIHSQLTDTQEFPKAQRELLRLVAHPGLSSQVLRGRTAAESVAYYGYQHLLRRTAAELYVQALERSNFAEPLVERGAQIFRKVLENPRIGQAYRPDPRDTEALDYYRKAESESRQRLFRFYAQLIFRLPTGSPEVVKGIEMLSRAQWLHQFNRGSEAEGAFSSSAQVGKAYAHLLDASTSSQRAATKEARKHLLQWIPPLEADARRGNREALRALVMASRHERPAESALALLERNGDAEIHRETEGLRRSLQHRDQRRAEDLRRRPELTERQRLLNWLGYRWREWFWFWH